MKSGVTGAATREGEANEDMLADGVMERMGASGDGEAEAAAVEGLEVSERKPGEYSDRSESCCCGVADPPCNGRTVPALCGLLKLLALSLRLSPVVGLESTAGAAVPGRACADGCPKRVGRPVGLCALKVSVWLLGEF